MRAIAIVPPRSFLTALAAVQSPPKCLPPIFSSPGSCPPHDGVSFSTALSMQRTSRRRPKYERHETRRPTALLGENDDNLRETEDDESPPRRRRGRRARPEFRETIDGGDNAARALESSLRFLGRPVPVPFLEDVNLPLVYPLSVLLGVFAFPPTTGGLLVFFSGASLSSGRDSDEVGSARINDQSIEEVEEEGALLPLGAFAGALASAALLSPQGLVSGGGSFSLSSPLALFAVGLGGLTILVGIQQVNEEEERWEERDRREGVVKEERRRMDRWDQDLEELFSGKEDD